MKIFEKYNLRNFDFKGFLTRFLCVFIGAFIVSIVYNAFVKEYTLVSGGVSGLAIIVNEYFGISTTVFINVGTILLLLLSFIILGFKKTSDAVVGYVAYGLMLSVTEPIAHYINITFDSFLFSVILYGALSGLGYGLIYRPGYNTGGSDSIVAITQKFIPLPYAVISNALNSGIIIVGAATFGITKSIYALIFLFVCNFITDRVILGSSDSKLCLIKTRRQKELEEFIKNDLEIGYTLIESTNGIGILRKQVVFCIVPSDRFYDLKRELMLIDKKAELISSDCYTVEGGYTNLIIDV